jgi:crotonobetainyl-CoA:carnitine CoA-transferase CaiB-like acyl-CoA transferase
VKEGNMTLSFKGVKVIQTASAAAGPMAGRMMADWGADVIIVEHTVRKAQAQQRQSAGLGMFGQRTIASNINYINMINNRNKRCVAVNLSLDSGREIIYKMLKDADVFLANFRPREFVKFKLEYETLSKINPKLVVANITGFGMKGPDKDNPGFGPVAGDSRSGFLHVLQAPGAEPVQMPMSFADYLTGLSLAFGIMAALYLREKTGVGQQVDASLFNTMAWAISSDIQGTLITKNDRHAVSRRDRGTPLTNYYQSKDDRWVYLMLTDLYWPNICKALGRPQMEHEPRFETPLLRAQNNLALFDIIESEMRKHTLDEWTKILNEAVMPWAPVQTLPEVINDAQARANDFFLPFDHPTYGHMELMSGPVKLSKTPEVMRIPAPESGQHTDEVLKQYGYSEQDIARFREEGAII